MYPTSYRPGCFPAIAWFPAILKFSSFNTLKSQVWCESSASLSASRNSALLAIIRIPATKADFPAMIAWTFHNNAKYENDDCLARRSQGLIAKNRKGCKELGKLIVLDLDLGKLIRVEFRTKTYKKSQLRFWKSMLITNVVLEPVLFSKVSVLF